MRNRYYLLVMLLALTGIFLSQSCMEKNQQSQFGESKSHEFGTNCMTCHTESGTSGSVFTIAGSVLDEARADIQKKCVIKLYTQPRAQGKLVATIHGDAMGNFFTDEKIDYSAGLYPTLLGTPGVKEDTKHMPKPIYNGACNSCHGPTTEKLGID